MRMLSLLRSDIRFQYRYGFYFLYLIFTVLYIALLFALPASWREKAAALLIFTDPAAMGLFFMGAIVLYEKSERVLDSIAISPAKPREYVLAKLLSIGLISTAAALAIGIPAGTAAHPVRLIAGVFLCSCLFSSIGLIIGGRVSTLNRFLLLTVPAEILIVVPAVVWLFRGADELLALHPGVAMMMLLIRGNDSLLPFVSLLVWTAAFAALAAATVKRMLVGRGGVRL